jgi:multidrug efflux pump subunit AcrB
LDQRCRPETFFTAIATAFFCPTSTTSFLPRVPEEEVLVTLDPDRTAALGLTADEISAAIRAADAKVQAGRLRGEETDLVLGITGEITSLDRLRAVVLREDADGSVTLLGDVAQRILRLDPATAPN